MYNLFALKEFSPFGNSLYELPKEIRIFAPNTSESFMSLLAELFSDSNITKSSDKNEADILLVTDSNFRICDNDDLNNDGYIFSVSAEKIIITAPDETALYYGCITIMQFNKVYGGVPFGNGKDYPDIKERCLHIDIARKYFTKEWIIQRIKEISFLKLNAIQLHFNENEGFRIECETDPTIVSEQHLTKNEIREILKAAEFYKIEIIPALDTPGHLKHILKAHPEFWLIDNDGYISNQSMDMTNPKAVAFIKALFDEYAELFKGCKSFNIGSDESFGWENVKRMHFSSWKVLTEYAEKTWGKSAIAHDVFINYINEISAYLEAKGFTVRAWNDGAMRSNEGKNFIKLSKTLEICYWSDNKTLGAGSVQGFIDNGNNIYNASSQYLYYVVDNNYVQVSPETVYREWTPGTFSQYQYKQGFTPPYPKELKGACYCIWCDRPKDKTPEQVAEESRYRISAMAAKSWSGCTSIPYEEYNRQIQLIIG